MIYEDVIRENAVFAENEKTSLERRDKESERYNFRHDNNIVIAIPRRENNTHGL